MYRHGHRHKKIYSQMHYRHGHTYKMRRYSTDTEKQWTHPQIQTKCTDTLQTRAKCTDTDTDTNKMH